MYFELKILKSPGKASSFTEIYGILKDFSELNLCLEKKFWLFMDRTLEISLFWFHAIPIA